MPMISIIVPAFNAERFVQRALNGVRDQTYAKWEVIVIEDGSCDGTEAIVKQFARSVPQRVTFARNDCNLGVSATRNRALWSARGEIVAFLDADDWWTRGHLGAGQDTLQMGADFCYSGFTCYDEVEMRVGRPVVPTVAQLREPLPSLFRQNFVQTSSLVMMWRTVAQKLDGFDPELRIGEDVDYWLRLLGTGHVLQWTGKTTCIYAKHRESAMAKSLLVAEESVNLFRRHLGSTYIPLLLRKRRLVECLHTYGRMQRKKNRSCAYQLFAEAYRYGPLNGRCAIYILMTMLGGKADQ